MESIRFYITGFASCCTDDLAACELEGRNSSDWGSKDIAGHHGYYWVSLNKSKVVKGIRKVVMLLFAILSPC